MLISLCFCHASVYTTLVPSAIMDKWGVISTSGGHNATGPRLPELDTPRRTTLWTSFPNKSFRLVFTYLILSPFSWQMYRLCRQTGFLTTWSTLQMSDSQLVSVFPFHFSLNSFSISLRFYMLSSIQMSSGSWWSVVFWTHYANWIFLFWRSSLFTPSKWASRMV